MNAPTRLSPKVEFRGNVKIITFTCGRNRGVDNVIASELEGHTDDVVGGNLLLDFTNVDFITSIELGTLISLHNKMKEAGGRLTLFNLKPKVFEVFKVTRLVDLISICREA